MGKKKESQHILAEKDKGAAGDHSSKSVQEPLWAYEKNFQVLESKTKSKLAKTTACKAFFKLSYTSNVKLQDQIKAGA